MWERPLLPTIKKYDLSIWGERGGSVEGEHGRRLENVALIRTSRHSGHVLQQKTDPRRFIWEMFNGNIRCRAGGCCKRWRPECIINKHIHFHRGRIQPASFSRCMICPAHHTLRISGGLKRKGRGFSKLGGWASVWWLDHLFDVKSLFRAKKRGNKWCYPIKFHWSIFLSFSVRYEGFTNQERSTA